MTEFSKYPPGTFCWVEVATTDAGAAKKFYTELFGWAFNDNPSGPDTVYTMFNKGGNDVCALYEMSQEQRAQGRPPTWLSYVSVASADESAAKARTLGGTILMEPFDVFDVGRMAMLQDPTGATFAIWQPRSHVGARLANEPGSFTWNELYTRDMAAAGSFYRSLFGWTDKVMELGPIPYTVFQNDGRGAGGMLAIAEEWGPVPPHWLAYFAVEDCDRTVQRAQALGAQVRVPAMDIPQVGRFSTLQDPQGAAFAVIRLENPD